MCRRVLFSLARPSNKCLWISRSVQLKVTVFKSCCIIFYVKYYNSPPAEHQVYENTKIYFDKYGKQEKEYVYKAPTHTHT